MSVYGNTRGRREDGPLLKSFSLMRSSDGIPSDDRISEKLLSNGPSSLRPRVLPWISSASRALFREQDKTQIQGQFKRLECNAKSVCSKWSPWCWVKWTVKSLFSAPTLIYLNRCRTTGAKLRTALKKGGAWIFTSKSWIWDCRKGRNVPHQRVKRDESGRKKPHQKKNLNQTGAKKREALSNFNHALTTGSK